MVILKRSNSLPKKTTTLILLFLFSFQIGMVVTSPISNSDLPSDKGSDNSTNTKIVYQNPEKEPTLDEKIQYYEEHYQPYVISNMPDPAYNEESGIWKKGDPGVHTKDGDFETQVLMWTIHLGQYEKTVDQLVQEAIANDCDFIAFTNLDGIRVSRDILNLIFQALGIPSWALDILLGSGNDLTIYAGWQTYYDAIQQARYNYRNSPADDPIEIFIGTEKTIGEDIQYLDQLQGMGIGKRVQCVLPYNPNMELTFLQEIVSQPLQLDPVLNKMETFWGSTGWEGGTTMFSPHIGVLDLWSDADYRRLSQVRNCAPGVVSVAANAVDTFIEFDPSPSSINWDTTLSSGTNIFAAAGSENYVSGTGGPGLTTKTYVKTWTPGYFGIMEGFKLGRVFTAQQNIIDRLDFTIEDFYDQKAYMGDTIVSYNNQTVKIKAHYNSPIDHINLISNYSGNLQIYTTFTSDNWTDNTVTNEISMQIQLPHNDASYFLRLEGVAANGYRFFSAPLRYQKSNVLFPEIHFTFPTSKEFYTNNGSQMVNWTKSIELDQVNLHVLDGYIFDVPSNPPTPPYPYNVNNQLFFDNDGSVYLDQVGDGWNTLILKGRDTTTGATARDYVYIRYTESPVVNILNPINNSYSKSDSVTVSWQGQPYTGHQVENYNIWLDANSPILLGPSVTSYEFTGLTEGQHIIHVQINQTDNYETFTANLTVYIDLTNPLLDITAPSEGQTFNENKTWPVMLINFTAADPDVCMGPVDYTIIQLYKDIGNDGTYTLIDTKTDDYDDDINEIYYTNYTAPWEDGSYKINITIYDLAGNFASLERTYHLDFYDPRVWLPTMFISGSKTITINWTQFDTATAIDTVKLDLMNGTIIDLDKFTNGTTITYPDQGEYPIHLTVNDTEGHYVERSSMIYIDLTKPSIYTIWIDDTMYDTSTMFHYFRVGITTNDYGTGQTGVKNVTLNYQLYTDPETKYYYSMKLTTVRSSKIMFEVDYYTIISRTVNNQVNISFSLTVADYAGNIETTDSYEHEIKLILPPRGDKLTATEIFIIIGSVAGGVAIGGYIGYRIKRKRDFGEFAKYY